MLCCMKPKNSILTRSASPDLIIPSQIALSESDDDFLTAITNKNTKTSYSNGINLFFGFIASSKITDVVDIEPKHVSKFVAWLSENEYGVSTSRLYLSAVRMFLDHCVVDGLISVNPAKAIKLPKYSAKTGKTPVIVPEQVRQILDAIPSGPDARPVDHRDRALIGLMVFSFFRISAALSLKVKDYELRGSQRWLIGEEKGSKRHEMPCHPDLIELLDRYISESNLNDPEGPLFQSSIGKSGRLTGKKFDRTSAWRMVRKRAASAQVHRKIGNHSFRATGITTYLNAGGTLEDARIMANHSNATTTKLYDRTGDQAKIQEVSRIKI